MAIVVAAMTLKARKRFDLLLGNLELSHSFPAVQQKPASQRSNEGMGHMMCHSRP